MRSGSYASWIAATPIEARPGGEPDDDLPAAPEAHCSKGWANRCRQARGKKCRCACGGRNHNHGQLWASRNGQRHLHLSDSGLFEPRRDDTGAPIWAVEVHGSAPREGVFTFRRRDGAVEVLDPNGRPVLHRWVSHSPDGFEWGYGGSGPADLALNLLAYYLPSADAWRWHQDAKRAFVEGLPREGGTIEAAALLAWVVERLGGGT